MFLQYMGYTSKMDRRYQNVKKNSYWHLLKPSIFEKQGAVIFQANRNI